MFKDKEIRKGIISSIIASLIFLIFFQPILNSLWTILSRLSENTYSGYIDNVYKNAALGHRNWIDYLSLNFLFGFLFVLITALLIRFRRKIIFIQQKIKYQSISDENEKQQYHNKINKGYRNRTLFYIKHGKKIVVFTYLYQTFIFLVFADTLFKAYVDLQLNASFEQRLVVLAPNIDDQQEEVLRSQWASMTSRKDYEVFNKNFEQLANLKNVELPELLLK
jgi:hypothetical protein